MIHKYALILDQIYDERTKIRTTKHNNNNNNKRRHHQFGASTPIGNWTQSTCPLSTFSRIDINCILLYLVSLFLCCLYRSLSLCRFSFVFIIRKTSTVTLHSATVICSLFANFTIVACTKSICIVQRVANSVSIFLFDCFDHFAYAAFVPTIGNISFYIVFMLGKLYDIDRVSSEICFKLCTHKHKN